MEEKFIKLFAEALELQEPSKLSRHTIFRNLDEWNSLAYLSLIAMIDEEYGVVIDGKDFSNLVSIGDLIDEIQRRKNQ